MFLNKPFFKNQKSYNRYKLVENMKYGIVREILECMPEADDPKVYVLAAVTSNSKFLGANDCNRSNSAAGLDYEHAYRAAVSECVERYCSAFQNDVLYSNYTDLKKSFDVIEPYKFSLYTDEQYDEEGFPYKKLDNRSFIGWTEVIDVKKGKPYMAPAALIYLPYQLRKDEDLVCHCVSTGLSCATTYEEAILKGIYEALERDMFSITWMNKLSFPLFDISSNDEIETLYDRVYKIQNCKYNLIKAKNEMGITTVIGVLDDKKGGAIVAAATRANEKEAIKKAMLELSQGRIAWKKEFVEGVEVDCLEDFSDITTLEQHVMLYTKKGMKKHMQFLYDSDEIDPIESLEFNTIREELDYVLDILNKNGYDVYYKDLTTDDVYDIGYRVVKVIIPGLVELTVRHKYPVIGSKRLRDVPRKIGYSAAEVFNKYPHPFP